eukprot:3875618-Pyramimonas_sp.AAC.1
MKGRGRQALPATTAGSELSDRALYDAVGIHSDPRCLQRRVVSALRAWGAGRTADAACAPAPAGKRTAQ